MNQLILGDCLEVLKKIDAESIDLIYLDPPFFSNRNYEVIWGDDGEIRSFQDRWSGGIDHYIVWLKERVQELYRVLKSTGSLFLHCDWHANAHIRVYILDKIFGEEHFRNHITWKRSDTHNDARKQYPVISDYILYYTKSDQYTFYKQHTEHAPKTLREWYLYLEMPDGSTRKMTKDEIATQTIPKGARRFNTDNMASPNPRPNLMYVYKGYPYPLKGWRYSQERMAELDQQGKLLFPSKPDGRIMLKRYFDEQEGAVVGDLWTDIDQIRAAKSERIGYPTQKPESLLERILSSASNEGDCVLDPFVGGGTTVVVADRMNRQWIGIDQSVAAIKVSELRLYQQRDLFSKPFVVQLHKYDYDTLRYKDAFEFESWMIGQFGGVPNAKQKGDLGIDGKTREGKPIQVKRSENIGRNVIDNFVSACKRFDKKLYEQSQHANEAVGVIIAFSFGKGAIQEVARLKNEENLIIRLVTVEEIVLIAKKPTLTVELTDNGFDKKHLREIEFLAKGESAVGIEFYSWDWNYQRTEGIFKPEILRDTDGKHTRKFKAGTHCIAVKVVDRDGLESLEVFTLKVNGDIRKEWE